jgi:carbamoyl-phosphate synthase large subunit
MKSTGEVMGIDSDFATAFAKSQLGAGTRLPHGGTCFVSVKDSDKPHDPAGVREAGRTRLQVVATGGTAALSGRCRRLPVERVNKVAEGRPHIVDRIIDGEIALIFNTTEGWQSLKDSQSIRASALKAKVPYFTTAAASVAAVAAIAALRGRKLEVRSLQDYYAESSRFPRHRTIAGLSPMGTGQGSSCSRRRGGREGRILRDGECRKAADAGGRL